MLYIGNGNHEIEAYNINSRTRKWVYKSIEGYPYPTLAHGLIYSYSFDGLVALNAKTGEEKCTYNPPSYKWISSWKNPCVVLDDDKVYRAMGNIKP